MDNNIHKYPRQPTEIELVWNGEKFTCRDKRIEQFLRFKLQLIFLMNEVPITEFLQRCGFQLVGYKYVDGSFKIEKDEGIFIDINDEGSGFKIIFELAAIMLFPVKIGHTKSRNTCEFIKHCYLFEDYKEITRFCVNSESIKPMLHPLLFDRIKDIEARCRFLAPKDVKQYLKCTVNPSGDCGTCQHFESDGSSILYFKEGEATDDTLADDELFDADKLQEEIDELRSQPLDPEKIERARIILRNL